MSPNLDLHVPGLLAAPRRLRALLALPVAPALQAWHARAQVRDAAAGRLGFIRDALAVQHAPLAALAWLGASGCRPDGNVFIASPVHLRAGMNDVVLFSGPALAIADDERERLAHDIATFFGDAPRLRCARREWFIHVNAVHANTTPLHIAQGEAVRDLLPDGQDARKLHAWMNELQMFLHAHVVNRERAARGLPALNGIWIWGGGDLPDISSRGTTVFARTNIMRGLGMLLGEARDATAVEEMLPVSGNTVIEITACADALDADDVAAWQDAVSQVADDVLAPVLAWLATNRAASATLHAGDGKARTVQGGRGRWWSRAFRRREPLCVSEEA